VNGEADAVRVHYLGHSAFVLRFGAGPVVLTDYGAANAWVEWGWDSPIRDIGTLVPDVCTYSHLHHEDHHDPGRVPAASQIVHGGAPTRIGSLEITPIAVREASAGDYDNYAYLFSWQGVRVVHLGDCQADILQVAEPEGRRRWRRIIPQACDLVLLPIESQERVAAEAVKLLRLLLPACAVPMHYWGAETLREFLNVAATDEAFRVRRSGTAQLSIPGSSSGQGTLIVPMDRNPFRDWDGSGGPR